MKTPRAHLRFKIVPASLPLPSSLADDGWWMGEGYGSFEFPPHANAQAAPIVGLLPRRLPSLRRIDPVGGKRRDAGAAQIPNFDLAAFSNRKDSA